MDFLQIKIEGLLLLRDRIVRGIKAMKQLSKERMYIGCGNGGMTTLCPFLIVFLQDCLFDS